MMARALAPFRRLFTVRYPYPDAAQMRRAHLLLLMCGLLLAVNLAAVAMVLRFVGGGGDPLTLAVVNSLVVGVAVVICYLLVQTGYVGYGDRVIVLTAFVAMTFLVAWTNADASAFIAFSAVVVLASVMLGAQGLVVSTAASALSVAALHHLRETGVLAFEGVTLHPVAVAALVLVADAAILWFFSADREAALREMAAASNRLRVTARISQTAVATLDLETMLSEVVERIRSEFNLYHVQIFLIDEAREYAVLQASTGAAGQSLLDRGHRLAVGSLSVIGQVTAIAKPLIALDTDPRHRRNQFLPATRTELALPLMVGDTVIGALDVQSTRPHAFTEEDVEAFRVMANQLAATIENARLFAEQQRRAEESQALLREARASLAEVERLNRRLVRQAWDEYLEARGQEVVGITLENNQPRLDTAWTPGLALAATENRTTINRQGSRTYVSVPLRFGGEVIGALEVEVPPALSPAEVVDVTHAVATRLALTVQNVRLLEQSQRQAQYEYQLGEIAAQLQSQLPVDEMLSAAVGELGRALGADRASIRLGVRSSEAVFAADEDEDGGAEHMRADNGRRGD